jgi:hypothetical protein
MAVNFDGATEHYTTGVALTVRDNWTLASWINIDALGGAFEMCLYNGEDGGAGPYNGYGFGVGGDNGGSGSKLIGLYGGIAWKNTGYTFSSTGVWYHVVMTRNSGTLSFYVNGSTTGYADTSADNGTPSGTFAIATQDRNSEGLDVWSFNGKMAEVGAWNRALSTGEIAALAKGYSPDFFPRELKRYHRLLNTSDVVDYATGATVTTGGTPDTFDHPRVIYPNSGFVVPTPSAVAATIRRYSLTTLGVG